MPSQNRLRPTFSGIISTFRMLYFLKIFSQHSLILLPERMLHFWPVLGYDQTQNTQETPLVRVGDKIYYLQIGNVKFKAKLL